MTHRSRIALGIWLLACALASYADGVEPPSLTYEAPPAPALTHSDLETFLDGMLPTALDRADIAGASVSVVKDGAILLAKGYGYADVAARIPVDPARTLFRIGSTGKTMTWTAVMQLVEAGRIDLDQDVNAYLDFKIPPAFGKPITVRDLMLHTPGFEEALMDHIYDDPRMLMPLRTYLRTHIPAQIFPPGEILGYSNYGAALAGYIVERVSGERFEDYARKHIFEPLGMSSTSFDQPLPPGLRERMARGYLRASENKPYYFEIAQVSPAGSTASTAVDMATYMIAHLQKGEAGGVRILRRETSERMQAPGFSPAPQLGVRGSTLGFLEEDRNGRRILTHPGDTMVFHAAMYLLTDVGVGVFVVVNSAGRSDSGAHEVRTSLFKSFMDRYFPDPRPEPTYAKLEGSAERALEIQGPYISSRRIDSNFFGLANLLGQTPVHALPDGSVEFLKGPGGGPMRWRETSPYVWEEPDVQAKLAAVHEPNGKLKYIVFSDGPTVSVQPPAPWWMTGFLGPTAFGVALGILVLTVVSWPVVALIRRHYAVKIEPREMRTSLALRLTALIFLIFFAIWLWLLAHTSEYIAIFNRALFPWLRALQLLGLIGVAGTVFVCLRTVRAWRHRENDFMTRVALTCFAVACLALSWYAFVYRLLAVALK